MSSHKGGDGSDTVAPLKSYHEQFDEIFPYYLAIGMTYDQFWNEDSCLAVAYRKADKIRTEKKNQELWLQGAYIYEGILRASPILQAFAKKGTKPNPYVEQPYELFKREDEKTEENKDKAVYEKGMAKMERFMSSFNKKLKGEG